MKILHTDDIYTVFPRIAIAIIIHFRYLPSATTKRGVNETRVIAIKFSKTNPPKNNRNKGMWGWAYKKDGNKAETKTHKKAIPLQKYGGKEKDMKTTLHLL